MSFTNMFTLGPSPLGINYSQTNTYSIGDMVTWTAGKQTIRFGGEYKRQAVDAPYFDVFPNGELFYLGFSAGTCPAGPGQADCGVFKDFLSGLNGLSVIGSGTNSIHNRANDFSAFFQEDWKVTRRLTLNLGLRYDYFGPTSETDGHLVGFDPSHGHHDSSRNSRVGHQLPNGFEHLRLGRHRRVRAGRQWKLVRDFPKSTMAW